MSKVGVIGQGYVGLSLSISAASAGHTVIGFDLSSEVIEKLSNSDSTLNNISNEKINHCIKNETYLPTTDPSKLAECEIIVIAVPTPLDQYQNPDLSFINSAVQIINKNLKKDSLIINESTSFPGTLRNIIAEKIATGFVHEFAAAPERIDPGNDVWNLYNTPRLISGLTQIATKKAEIFYKSFTKNVVISKTPEVAEMSKLLENTFRQVNIALINQISQICYKLGINTQEVIEAASTKPFGFMRFIPGAGVGGHCIPVDPIYLSHIAEMNKVSSSLILLADQINREMPRNIVERIQEIAGAPIYQHKVVIIGLSYKSNTSDIRESPAIAILNHLRNIGCKVTWHDDIVGEWNGEKSNEINKNDVAIVVTKHDNLDLSELKNNMFVLDCTGTILWAHQL
jgi:UDP-N-acetyl-D-glucosamine dehydrogenase